MSPAAKRARRRAAGRSGGIFERVPGSSKPYDFRYVQPPAQTHTSGHQTLDRWPTPDLSPEQASFALNHEQQQRMSEPFTSPGMTMAIRSRKPAYSLNQPHHDIETSRIATTTLSEHTIAGLDAAPQPTRTRSGDGQLQKSMNGMPDRFCDSTVGAQVAELRGKYQERKVRREVKGSERAAEREGRQAQDAILVAGGGASARGRVSRCFEHLGGEESGSRDGVLAEQDVGNRRFFGFGRKGH
ncbi:uncharacterized protein HMPREF1541_03055 [Cyphellophora europaea CBS 101466]|uniref:Uncharacterized protein n=1 Tax=Cyphellophora europaea (strain CBS 101466) TaxID=1220924 RepID=W2RXR7_CYPE1|nr:uncharacterized protein HMPREF1541_03055 [Cyphellophora europaea CBS 101466]ETN41120.1 hypothetical protein HMPREF1541_03055 [Cyphellophora europaea CBS 101466]